VGNFKDGSFVDAISQNIDTYDVREKTQIEPIDEQQKHERKDKSCTFPSLHLDDQLCNGKTIDVMECVGRHLIAFVSLCYHKTKAFDLLSSSSYLQLILLSFSR
jgi:hypothetical protein